MNFLPAIPIKKSNKIKILRIIARLNTGGPALHALILSKNLDSKKYETLLVTGAVDKHEGDLTYKVEENNLSFIYLKNLGRSIIPSNDLKSFFHILGIVFKFKPHIIHTHTAKSGTLGRLAGFIFNLFHWKNKSILVHTYHGHVFHSYFGRITTCMFISIEKLLGRFSQQIVAVSEKQKDEIGNIFHIVPPSKIKVIRLGIYLQEYLEVEKYAGVFRKEKGLTGKDILIGIVGRMTAIKNISLFLKAGRILINRLADKPIYLVLVGGGEDRPMLELMGRQLGIEKHLIFTGWLTDLAPLYADLDLMANTSLNEGTPLSLIEAMASGCPVVATDVGGTSDLLGPKIRIGEKSAFHIAQRGILCTSDDAYGFAFGLKFLIENPAYQRRFVKAGREFTSQLYGHERLVNDITELYDNLLLGQAVTG